MVEGREREGKEVEGRGRERGEECEGKKEVKIRGEIKYGEKVKYSTALGNTV